MGIKRHKPEEIVTKLRQVEVLCGQGMPRIDAIRQVQITEQTFYRWRKQYGGMGTDQLKELKHPSQNLNRWDSLETRSVIPSVWEDGSCQHHYRKRYGRDFRS